MILKLCLKYLYFIYSVYKSVRVDLRLDVCAACAGTARYSEDKARWFIFPNDFIVVIYQIAIIQCLPNVNHVFIFNTYVVGEGSA
jgi:hypothetical protein